MHVCFDRKIIKLVHDIHKYIGIIADCLATVPIQRMLLLKFDFATLRTIVVRTIVIFLYTVKLRKLELRLFEILAYSKQIWDTKDLFMISI